MIRYLISFPPEAKISPEGMYYFREMISNAANAREWRDVILSQGATITDMRVRVPPRIRNAQRRLR